MKKLTVPKALPWLLLIAGLIGAGCSFVLSLDEFHILQNPNYIPSCNLNPIIACGSVMKSAQAHVFGFPNPFMGLITFSAVATVGGALVARANFKRWFWLLFQAGLLFAVGFVHWLFSQTVYSINALCPYCMGVWLVSITSFWYVLVYNLREGNLKLPGKTGRAVNSFIQQNHFGILLLWFIILAALILKHFWYYYGHYF